MQDLLKKKKKKTLRDYNSERFGFKGFILWCPVVKLKLVFGKKEKKVVASGHGGRVHDS